MGKKKDRRKGAGGQQPGPEAAPSAKMIQVEAHRFESLNQSVGDLLEENRTLKVQALKGERLDKIVRVRDRVLNVLTEEKASLEDFDMAVALMRLPMFEQMLGVVGQRAAAMQQAREEQEAGKDIPPPAPGNMKVVQGGEQTTEQPPEPGEEDTE